MGVTKTLQKNGLIEFLLGNDLAGGEVSPLPHMCTTRFQRREMLKDIDNK